MSWVEGRGSRGEGVEGVEGVFEIPLSDLSLTSVDQCKTWYYVTCSVNHPESPKNSP